MNKNEKAITLVALVITIIVLLILAGVTLRIVFNGGIIDKSQNAVDQYSYQSKNEEEQLAEFENFLEKYFNKEEFPKDETPGDIEEGRKGTEADPYVIESIEDLVAFSYNVNSGKTYAGQTITLGRSLFFDGSNDSYVDENAKYIEDEYGYIPNDSGESIKKLLTDDEGKGFIPVGLAESTADDETKLNTTFQGTFDGKNHYLSGIYINSTSYAGVFGLIQAENITIKNLGVEDGKIKGTNYAGGIIGKINTEGKIENCYNKSSKVEGSSRVGGIVADGSNVINCYNTGDITCIGGGPTGGIIGNGSNAINCYNTGNITGTQAPTGGIIGVGNNIFNCYNIGDVTGSNLVGGISGGYTNNITNCYNSGTITGKTNNPTGGIIGNGGNITNCYNFGIVEGIYCMGGIAGLGSNITNCYNVNDVTNTGADRTGGIAGAGSNITNCHNIGNVTGPDETQTGEIVGSGTASNDCYYLTRIKETGESDNANANGATGKNESDMNEITNIETFVNTLNTKVQTNNSDSKNTKWKEWKLKDGYPVFK